MNSFKSTIRNREKYLYLIVFFSISLVGFSIILYSTTWGIGLFGSDSFHYIAAGINFARGLGFYIPVDQDQLMPLTIFPPLLPMMVAFVDSLGLDVLVAGRLFYALIFAASTVLFGITINRATQSIGFALFGSLLFLNSTILIKVYSMIVSEGPFLLFTLGAFLLLERYIIKDEKGTLFVAGLLLGLICITRYIGVANVITAAAVILVMKPGFRKKITALFAIFLLGLLPLFLWTARNFLLTGTINQRLIDFHPPVLKNYLALYYYFLTWIVPEDLVLGNEKGILIGLLLAAFSAIGIVWLTPRKQAGSFSQWLRSYRNQPVLILTYEAYIFSYLFFLVLAKTFFEPKIGFENRIFSPLLMSLLILACYLLFVLWESNRRIMRVLVVVVSAYLLFFTCYNGWLRIFDNHENGIGLARKSLQKSTVLAQLGELPELTKIYNNDVFSTYFYTGSVGYHLNKFPPPENVNDDVIVAIFSSEDSGGFHRKYSGQLELIESDHIVTLYRYLPAP